MLDVSTDAGSVPRPSSAHAITAAESEPSGTRVQQAIARVARRRVRIWALVIFDVLIMVVVGALEPGFLAISNIRVIIDGMALPASVAAVQALLLAAGRFDLAVGGIGALSAILAGKMMLGLHIPVVLAVVLGLLFGSWVGWINGVLIERFKLNSIVMTLATWWIMIGAAQGVTQGIAPGGFPDAFSNFGQTRVFGFLIGDYYSLAIVVVIGVVFAYRRFGYHVLATGGDREAARLKGIKVERVGIMLFALSGLVSAFAGIVFAAQLGSAQSTTYYNLALQVIAAAVIGGAGLNGGEGSVLGTVFGLLLLNIVTNAVIFVGVSALWSQAIYGAVLVVAITVDAVAIRARARTALRRTLQERDRHSAELSPGRGAES